MIKPFWSDLDPQDDVKIAELRSELVELMKEGYDTIPLTSLLVIIKANCLEEDNE